MYACLQLSGAGSLWSHEPVSQVDTSQQHGTSVDPVKVRWQKYTALNFYYMYSYINYAYC